jgi:hypothetical protein
MTNHRPNIEQAARDLLDDLGVIDDDHADSSDPEALHTMEPMPS